MVYTASHSLEKVRIHPWSKSLYASRTDLNHPEAARTASHVTSSQEDDRGLLDSKVNAQHAIWKMATLTEGRAAP